MDKETKVTEVLIIIFLIIIFVSPFMVGILLIDNDVKSRHIKQLEIEINSLRFEQDYLEYVYEDNYKQGIYNEGI